METCNEALRRVPNYGGALLERSKAYFYYLVTHWDGLTLEERKRYSDWALADAFKCANDHPVLHAPELFRIEVIIYIAFLYSDPDGFRFALAPINKIQNVEAMSDTLTDSQLAFSRLNTRAQAHQFLGEMEEAERTTMNQSDGHPLSHSGT